MNVANLQPEFLTGPNSSTDNAIPRFDSNSNSLKDSKLTIDNNGSITPTDNYLSSIGTKTNAMDNIYTAVVNASASVNIYPSANFTNKHVSLQLSLLPVSDVTLYLPITADTLVGRATTDTLTNKTISSAAFTGTQTGTITHSGQYYNTNSLDSVNSPVTGAIITSGGLGVLKNISCGSGIYLPTTGGTASQLNYYEEFDTSIAFTGPVSGNMSVHFTRIGRSIFFHWDSLYGTSTSAVKFTGTIAQTRFRPVHSIAFVVYGQNNSANTWLILNITNTGTVTFGLGPNDAVFTGSGGCAVWESCVCYTKN